MVWPQQVTYPVELSIPEVDTVHLRDSALDWEDEGKSTEILSFMQYFYLQNNCIFNPKLLKPCKYKSSSFAYSFISFMNSRDMTIDLGRALVNI